jgi:ketosteroid isomerase-like protein
MKRFAVLMLTAVIATFSAALWAQGVEPKSISIDPAEEIRALEKAFDEAIVRRDVSALDQLTSDDFTFTGPGGQVLTKAEVLKGFSTSATFKYEYRQTDELKIRVYGDAAVVTGRFVQTTQENGKDYSGAYRFTRVYVRQNEHWLSVTLQTTRIAEQ